MKSIFDSPSAYKYKLFFDGHDLLRTNFGKEMLNEFAVDYAKKHCVVNKFRDAERFVKDCIAERKKLDHWVHELDDPFLDGYEIGYFEVTEENTKRYDSDYILLNYEQLDCWDDTIPTWGLKFAVFPSRDRNGRINEIGFRILDKGSVQNAFKWLFMFGQQATYGLDRVNPTQPIVLCEGATDRIALTESGYNVVGLGSIYLNDAQREFLKGLTIQGACFDHDVYGIKQAVEHGYIPYTPCDGDPFDSYVKHGRLILHFDK